METQEKQISPAESLQLIQQMISSVKKNLSEDSYIFLMWGYLVLMASITQYSLIQFGYNGSWIWALLMPSGGVFSYIFFERKSKKVNVKTYIDNTMSYLWRALGASFGVVIGIMAVQGIDTMICPMIIMLYGVGTFVTGGVLSFKPLIIGGASCFVIAFVSSYFSIEIQLLFLSLSVVVSYIIPGHLLRSSN